MVTYSVVGGFGIYWYLDHLLSYIRAREDKSKCILRNFNTVTHASIALGCDFLFNLIFLGIFSRGIALLLRDNTPNRKSTLSDTKICFCHKDSSSFHFLK